MICMECGEVLPPGPLAVRVCHDERPSVAEGQDASSAPHHEPSDISDRFALGFTKALRWVADTFFARRYGHRAIVLETVAGVPGMVGATLQHLRSLRRMEPDRGWIKTLLDEAENERMHLMTFIEIAQPTRLERLLVLLVQGLFYNAFFLLYVVSPRTAHRVVGYFEEEAVYSYTSYLAEIDAGRQENIAAPGIAIDYWHLASDARLRDVVIAVRADEANHRDVNHGFADSLCRHEHGCERAIVHEPVVPGRAPESVATLHPTG